MTGRARMGYGGRPETNGGGLMARHRTDAFGNYLPIRLRFFHGAYYYRVWNNQEKRLVETRLADAKGVALKYGAALARWAELEGVAEPGTLIAQAINRYLTDNVLELAPATVKEYRRMSVRLIRVFGHVGLDDLEETGVAQYLDKHHAKAQGNREMSMLSSVYEAARRWGWTSKNPCRGVRRNRERKLQRMPSPGQIAALVAAADPQMAAIIQLAGLTGLRKKDLLELRLSDIRPEGLRVEISKTGRTVIYTHTATLDALLSRIRGLRRRVSSISLFCNQRGQAYTTSGFDSRWQRLKKRAGVDIRFHDLRRYAAKRAKERGGRDYAQALLDHASGATTDRYLAELVSTVVPVE